MFRVNYNIETGERREIEQTAYRDPNDHASYVVLDADQPAPDGMEVFDPAVEPPPDTTATTV